MSGDNVIISCLSDDDDDNDGNINVGSSSQKENIQNDQGATNNSSENGDAKPKVSMSPSKERAASNNDDDDDDEIEVVDSSVYRSQLRAAASTTATTTTVAAAGGGTAEDNDNDEELEIVGTQNEQKLPHIRHDCLEFRYKANCNGAGGGSSVNGTSSNDANAKFCRLCYCYVCDKPASECDSWFMGERGICSNTAATDADNTDGKAKDDGDNNNNTEPHKNHCNASDKGSQSQLWKNMRKAIKDGKDPSQVSNNREAAAVESTDNMQQYMQQYLANYSNLVSGAGPRQRNRIHATARGGARQMGSSNDDDSIFGGGASASNGSAYGSTTYAAAAAASAPRGGRSRSTGRQRSRSSGGGSGSKRPAPHDHRARIRTQQMLEDLYK
mmetsp:Transcript_21512/g.46753  ORF Transcript_21512/g.46753 Transcript_21512/m.46753 type:complete len:385 (-) Transcript_21512:260-1414(-)|eukprot:CAMPEP_0172325204 /NCGR_PEP_ID=MMETSP1058-20130122/53394_1 /TAXON_ID=83371 /ORGANISM="Detonula confervacea, Strain CCMP 353" /LENGTH=384 /DNA_ID=CAMNT_0013041683 /DNA_START=159 /DNA_END=1313 /DNA_ORIENTATION=-